MAYPSGQRESLLPLKVEQVEVERVDDLEEIRAEESEQDIQRGFCDANIRLALHLEPAGQHVRPLRA